MQFLYNLVLVHLTVVVELLSIVILLHVQCVDLTLHEWWRARFVVSGHILGDVEGLSILRPWA